MEITLTFVPGAPGTKTGEKQYLFVRHQSGYDHKIRVFGAYYLRDYPLEQEYGPCPECPFPNGEEDCAKDSGEGCPTTGWFREGYDTEYDTVYEKLDGEVLSFAEPPAPQATTSPKKRR